MTAVIQAFTCGHLTIPTGFLLAGRDGTDHLFLCDAKGMSHVDCSAEPLTYFTRFQQDVRARSATAMPEGHALRVSRLAITAQMQATGA